MSLTKQQAIEKHRKMWNWIADEILKRKRKITKKDYFNENLDKKNEEPPLLYCYACQYSAEQSGIILFDENICQFCPLDWHSDSSRMMCLYADDSDSDNIFTLWHNTNDWKKAAELARQIAELPERKEE